jgi:phage gp36-like protein
MAYCSKDDVIAELNGQDYIPFLDDDGTGMPADADAMLQKVIDRESAKIDGRISSIYQTPLSPPPPALRDACAVFVCEALYRRRLVPGERNPFTEEATDMRARLKMIGNGKLELDQNYPRAFFQGTFVSAPLAINFNSNTM